MRISTHTPHAGCDEILRALKAEQEISTHTPHAGCDPIKSLSAGTDLKFQLTHPMRGATLNVSIDYLISGDFNSHTPCGVRQLIL